MTEKTIFQFLDLSNSTPTSVSQIQEIVAGTYLAGSANGESYAQIIHDAANESGESAFSIIVRIFQELGISSSLPYMIAGTDPTYPGVYNFFNYGASDGAGNLARGLAYAKNAGWTTPRTALIEEAKLIAGTYTPICIIAFNETIYGYIVLAIEWGCAIIGILLKVKDLNNKFIKIITMLLYVIMGWCLMIFPFLIKYLSIYQFTMILGGGILYTTFKYDNFSELSKQLTIIKSKYGWDMGFCKFVVQAYKDNSYDFERACFSFPCHFSNYVTYMGTTCTPPSIYYSPSGFKSKDFCL